MKIKQLGAVLLGILAATGAHAGYATGKVAKVTVGRQGNQVFIELEAEVYTNWVCGTPHPNGYRYAFLLSTDNDRAMLATVLAAQISGQPLLVQGKGTCNNVPNGGVEDVDYVTLRPA